MLPLKWVVFLFMLFAIGTVISGFCEQAYVSQNGGVAVFAPFTETWATEGSSTIGKLWSVAINPDTYGAFWHMLTWDYAFFTGTWELVRYCLFIPVSAALAFAFIWTIGPIIWQVIATAIGGIV